MEAEMDTLIDEAAAGLGSPLEEAEEEADFEAAPEPEEAEEEVESEEPDN